jgi:uncharacterized protein YndB with AHSA1/START domain
MDSWWPLGMFTTSAMTGLPARAIRIEAKAGGTIVEIAADGTEHLWGMITTYDPYAFVSMDFHIPLPDEQVASRSLVEVRFTALAPERTRVRLTQSRWEAFGERAAMLQGGYGPGWSVIFAQAFQAACSRAAHAGDETVQGRQRQ